MVSNHFVRIDRGQVFAEMFATFGLHSLICSRFHSEHLDEQKKIIITKTTFIKPLFNLPKARSDTL